MRKGYKVKFQSNNGDDLRIFILEMLHGHSSVKIELGKLDNRSVYFGPSVRLDQFDNLFATLRRGANESIDFKIFKSEEIGGDI